MIKFFSRLLYFGDEVLGINGRNLDFIYRLNQRKYFPTVDDKLLTKEMLRSNGVPTPPALMVFYSHGDLKYVKERIATANGFAIKPAQGSGGRGIMILRRDSEGRFTTAGQTGKVIFSIEDLTLHISDILSGLYALERLSDKAFLEHLLEPVGILAELSYGGVPDIRVVVCQGQPVMAMARLPTRRSRGRANLHQGAFAFGIDIQTGQTTYAVFGNRNITEHPDTGKHLPAIKIPGWKDILQISLKAAGCVELGYLGVDIVVDKCLGPVVVELNARPGLNIQLANRKGLVRQLYGGRIP